MRPSLRHRLVNAAHSVLLVAGMAGLAWACTGLIWGSGAAIWAFLIMGGMLLLSVVMPLDLMLVLYGAQRISPENFPEGISILKTLAKRAELPQVPNFYYLPSALPNAFTTGHGKRTTIVVSDGLLRTLDPRELTAVLAHEISHIAHGDMWILRLADIMARVTSIFSFAGQVLVLINLPLVMIGAIHIPWAAPLVLIFSPTVMSLLQLALSRSREFDADLGAARLTRDPAALASALERLEHSTGSFWEEILLPGRRIPVPSLLRSHPPTEARVARLKEIALELFRANPYSPTVPLPPAWAREVRGPRWRRTGLWF